MMITRRRFLQIAGWCAAPLTVGAFASRQSIAWVADRTWARVIAFVNGPEAQLHAHFSYLTLDETGVEQYIADYQRFYGRLRRYRPLSSDIRTRYLMSTDFFRHGADESRTVRYVGFYDPDHTTCNNPLAKFDEPA